MQNKFRNFYMYRDIVDLYDLSHPNAVADLARWLLDNTASLYSINHLTSYLECFGHNAPNTTVAHYLQWFEDAYSHFTIRLFDASRGELQIFSCRPEQSFVGHWVPRPGCSIIQNFCHYAALLNKSLFDLSGVLYYLPGSRKSKFTCKSSAVFINLNKQKLRRLPAENLGFGYYS